MVLSNTSNSKANEAEALNTGKPLCNQLKLRANQKRDFTKNVFELDLLTKNVKTLKTVEDLQNGILCQAP